MAKRKPKPGRATDADVELCDRLFRERQLRVTPRELQTWRRLGLVSHYTVSLGRGKGKRPNYPPEALDEAAEVAEVLAGFKSLDFAVLELFGRGRNPTLAALKRAYKWWLDRTEAQAHAVLALFDGNGKVFSRRVRDEIREIGRAFPALAKHMEEVCRENARAEEARGEDEPASVADLRERVVADHFASFVDGDMMYDPELKAQAFVPRAGPAVPTDAAERPPISAARAALETASLEHLAMTRDFLQFSMLFADRALWPNVDEILDGPVSPSGLFGSMALFELATDPPLLAHLGALERLSVIPFDRDCAPLPPSPCPPFAYWRVPNGSGYDVADLVLDPLGGERKGEGYFVVLLLSQCSPRHPAIAVSDRMAAKHGRAELDEVWFVLVLRWDRMNRMMLTDQRSSELGRLLLEGVPRPHLYVPSAAGLLVPGHLADSDDETSTILPRSPVAPAVFRSPARDEKIAKARAFLSEYARQGVVATEPADQGLKC